MRIVLAAFAFVSLMEVSKAAPSAALSPNIPTTLSPLPTGRGLPVLPLKMPVARSDGKVVMILPEGERETTIHGELQAILSGFIADKGSPIATVIVADAKTGDILAHWIHLRYPQGDRRFSPSSGLGHSYLRRAGPLGSAAEC